MRRLEIRAMEEEFVAVVSDDEESEDFDSDPEADLALVEEIQRDDGEEGKAASSPDGDKDLSRTRALHSISESLTLALASKLVDKSRISKEKQLASLKLGNELHGIISPLTDIDASKDLSTSRILKSQYRRMEDSHTLATLNELKQNTKLISATAPVDKAETKVKNISSAGSRWFNIQSQELTPEAKKDINLLKMRAYLDPKRFYKRESKQGKGSAFPEVFQFGTVEVSAREFYSARIPKKQRCSSVVDEIISNDNSRSYIKKKFSEIQASKPARKRASVKRGKFSVKKKRNLHSQK